MLCRRHSRCPSRHSHHSDSGSGHHETLQPRADTRPAAAVRYLQRCYVRLRCRELQPVGQSHGCVGSLLSAHIPLSRRWCWRPLKVLACHFGRVIIADTLHARLGVGRAREQLQISIVLCLGTPLREHGSQLILRVAAHARHRKASARHGRLRRRCSRSLLLSKPLRPERSRLGRHRCGCRHDPRRSSCRRRSLLAARSPRGAHRPTLDDACERDKRRGVEHRRQIISATCSLCSRCRCRCRRRRWQGRWRGRQCGCRGRDAVDGGARLIAGLPDRRLLSHRRLVCWRRARSSFAARPEQLRFARGSDSISREPNACRSVAITNSYQRLCGPERA